MELSSHALSQSRTEGIDLDVAVLTNITHDHLDYHRDFESYRAAKARIFKLLKPGGVAVINIDDAAAAELTSTLPPQTRLMTVGIDQPADVNAVVTSLDHTGTTFRVQAGAQEAEFRTSLVGRHNVSNCLGAIAAGLHLGLSLEQCVAGIAALTHVPGRLQQVNPAGQFAVYVDYAHTPDAVTRAIAAVRQTTKGKVICVIGAGGDRDRTKRPLMARAAQAADTVVLTSDNPRSEDPLAIIQQMLEGVESRDRTHVEPDRRRAIAWAIEHASPGDAVLVAGKGHELVQEIAGERLPFDDVSVCRDCLGLATLETADGRRVRSSSRPGESSAIGPPHFDAIVAEKNSEETQGQVDSLRPTATVPRP
jgi:UDP-N-acetylmuramoyl-L-alanyl-D-glutamate--2,6-diaminopimelate ligase